MNDDTERGGAFPDGFVVPITGLLAFLFAGMAGASAYPAVSGSVSVGALLTPAIFALASFVCFRLRGRYQARSET